jgi:hypothetical protein
MALSSGIATGGDEPGPGRAAPTKIRGEYEGREHTGDGQ